MARKVDLFINIIFLQLLLLFTAKCSKLNVPRVLLPIFNDFSTNFTLEATEGGCYKWTTSRLDLVQLIPLDIDDEHDCSTTLLVLTITKERTKNTAIVLAEDTLTGQVLRCDVIVDVISSLNIVTTTRELFMEEAPEAFEVRAYDSQGNEFSTLEGVEFEWSLMPMDNNPANILLRFITFKNSPYETPPSIEAFEEMDKQGHIVLLEGVKTGSAKVSVKLPHQDYKHIQEIEVSLMVIANLIIEPSDIYILRGGTVFYRVIQVKHGRLEEIDLPNSQYYLDSENIDVGVIDKQSGYFTGLNIGVTNIFLHDTNVEDDKGFKLPSATVHVTEPARVHLTLLPYRNWATVLGEEHDIAVELYTRDDHKIYIGKGIQMETTIDQNYFSPTFRAANDSYISGKAIQQGPSEIKTRLISVLSDTLGTVYIEPQLEAKAEILIFGEIYLVPDDVVLPWDPSVKPRYDIELRANGGDGKFLWTSSNHSIGVVTQSGLVRTNFHGQFDVCANMLRNHHNRQCSKFSIVPPTQLEIVEFVMETEIGSPIFLNIALFGERPKPTGSTLTPFMQCKDIPFIVKTSDNNFYHDEKAFTAPVGISCSSVGIVALSVGTARVTVQYRQREIHLEETVTVSAYRPLKLLHPSCPVTILALGTSRYLVFTGGPRPWADRPSEHIIRLATSDPNLVEAIDSTNEFKVPGGSDTYVTKVICKDIGEATVTLTIYNKPLIPKCRYEECSATAKVICAVPEYIALQPEIKVPNSAGCPMDLNAERVIIQNRHETDLLVTVMDNRGRRFDNISSFEFKWEANPSMLATLLNPDGVFEKNYIEDNVYLPNKTYQTIQPSKNVGLVTVECTILGYKDSVLKANQVATPPKINPVVASITLYLVDDTIISPNQTAVYNHPLNKQSLLVKQGSGYNQLELSNKDVADIKYNEGLRQIEITPIQPGELHVTVRDLCLRCPPVVILLNVVYVAAIRVSMPDRVEIGKCIPVIVKFYDEFDNLMPLPDLEFLDLRFTLAEKIVKLKIANKNDSPWGLGEVRYILTGLQLGETKLAFAAGRGPKEVVSIPINVQVFAPLKVLPKNATLIVGSVLQFTTLGGPQPDTNVEYNIEDSDENTLGDLSLNGIFHATSIGHATITGRSVSLNPINGKKVTNTKDTVEINIVPLLGITISAPLTRFAKGTVVPVWATGLPERLSSLLIGSVDPPFYYQWSTSCTDVISINGIFYPFGVKDNPLNKVSVRVRGVNPGFCTLQLEVTLPGSVAGIANDTIVYSSSIEMEVIENLQLHGPPGFNGKTILMAPLSTIKLNTNRAGSDNLKYSVHGEVLTDAEINKKSVAVHRHLMSVSEDGTISSYSIPGRAMVVITATDEHGLKQTLSVIVEIKPVHYMLLAVHADWMVSADENIKVVPLGSKFNLVPSFHDNTGLKFTAAKCDLNYRISRLDLVEVKRACGCEEPNFVAHTIKGGSTVIKVWTENCFQVADYVHILSGQVASATSDSVTCGDVICMRSCVRDSKGKSGKWTSDTEKHLHLDGVTGVGQAIATESSRAYVNYDLTPAAKIEVEIEPISEITFVSPKPSLITNSPGRVFKIPILIKDSKHPDKKNNMHCQECCIHGPVEIYNFPFECVIYFDNPQFDVSEIFEVTPAFNSDTGLYSCNIMSSMELTIKRSTLQTSVILKVVGDNGVESSLLTIPFLPAVYVKSQELVITDSKTYTVNLPVNGLQKVLKAVTVVPLDEKLIEVGTSKMISDNTISFPIKVIDYHWKLQELHDPLSVYVNSKLTGQNIKVNIILGPETVPFCPKKQAGGSPLANFLYENKQSISILSSVLVLFIATLYIYMQYLQPVINVNVAGRSPHPCTTLRTYDCSRSHDCAALRAERTMMINSPQQNVLNTSQPRNLMCSPCSRPLNTSGSPPMRYGNEGMQGGRTSGNCAELRRNRRFL